MDILVVTILTSIIQSLFGVGVLLFGTPLLLLLEYSFMDVLLILLPISISINLLQVYKDYKYIDKIIYKNILFVSVPFIILFLLLVSKNKIDINTIVGLFLIFISLKDKIDIIHNSFEKLLSFNKIFYSIMGIVHGMTNLGGAFLTVKVFHADLNKYEKRATTAVSYMTFAIFQIITILFLEIKYEISNLLYIIICLSVYIAVNKLFFHKLSNNRYDKLFSLFLMFFGILLIGKGVVW
jgi:uncharacterized membrane protein YfcA